MVFLSQLLLAVAIPEPTHLMMWWVLLCPEVTMPTTPEQMTDAELDERLVRLYRQRYAASSGQRAGWHSLIQEVLAVQAERRNQLLGLPN